MGNVMCIVIFCRQNSFHGLSGKDRSALVVVASQHGYCVRKKRCDSYAPIIAMTRDAFYQRVYHATMIAMIVRLCIGITTNVIPPAVLDYAARDPLLALPAPHSYAEEDMAVLMLPAVMITGA